MNGASHAVPFQDRPLPTDLLEVPTPPTPPPPPSAFFFLLQDTRHPYFHQTFAFSNISRFSILRVDVLTMPSIIDLFDRSRHITRGLLGLSYSQRMGRLALRVADVQPDWTDYVHYPLPGNIHASLILRVQWVPVRFDRALAVACRSEADRWSEMAHDDRVERIDAVHGNRARRMPRQKALPDVRSRKGSGKLVGGSGAANPIVEGTVLAGERGQARSKVKKRSKSEGGRESEPGTARRGCCGLPRTAAPAESVPAAAAADGPGQRESLPRVSPPKSRRRMRRFDTEVNTGYSTMIEWD